MQAGQGGGGVQEGCRQGLCGKGWLPTLSDCLDTALVFFQECSLRGRESYSGFQTNYQFLNDNTAAN